MSKVVIIGGGAAGCFCAAELGRLHPDWDISVLEAGPRLMAKLAVTGGGRCNITNSFAATLRADCQDISPSGICSCKDFAKVSARSLEGIYPRGAALMKRLLSQFGPSECLAWFGEHGVKFVTQDDGCVFPRSQDAMQIVRTLENAMRRAGVKVYCNCKVSAVGPDLHINHNVMHDRMGHPDAIVLTTGGGTAGILKDTGIEIIPQAPSLFTLKINDLKLRELMGTVVDNVRLGLAGTRFRSEGTLLLTDWGVSGPATLKLSSYAARHLAGSGYQGTLLVNWLDCDESAARELLGTVALGNGAKMIANSHPSQLSDRLWKHLVARAGIRPDCRWQELGSKGQAKLINVLVSDTYAISGRARFKEEFVTCGGVSLAEIRPDTLESRKIPGLYLAGEVLDIDAITGGYNLQAAWSTAWTVAQNM